MKKEASDFALLSGAFAKDQAMAQQICGLLADEDIDEDEARMMLKLVGKDKLKSGNLTYITCNRHHHGYYPYWMNTYPWNTVSNSSSFTFTDTARDITSNYHLSLSGGADGGSS